MRGEIIGMENAVFNEQTAWTCVQFLKGLIGMGVPLNAISTGRYSHFHLTGIYRGTPLDTFLNRASEWRDASHFTDKAFSFHSTIARYLHDQGAEIGGDKKGSREDGIIDHRVRTWLPLLKQRGLDIKDSETNLTHTK